MGKLLSVLGISEESQAKLPEVVFKGERVVDALQKVYAKAPESPKKEVLAKTIAESVRLLLIKAQPYLIDAKKEQETKESEQELPKEHTTPHIQIPQPPPQPTPPQPTPPQPQPPQPTPPEPPEEEVMTCEEIKDTIKGLTLFAKSGDSEAKEIIKQLKIKLKNQNC